MRRHVLSATLLAFLPASVLAQGLITTYAGGRMPIDGAPATTQNIERPRSVIPDRAGGFYFTSADRQHRVYRVFFDGTLTAIAGIGQPGFSGDGGPALSASLNFPGGLALAGNGDLFIADTNNHRIRKVTPAGTISTVVGVGAGFSGDGQPAILARLSRPYDVAVDASGALFIADTDNHRIRKVTPEGIISTIVGIVIPPPFMGGFGGDGGPAVSARLSQPRGIALDASGTLFIADSFNHRIRRVTTNGVIATVAGNGQNRFGGDGGLATAASLSYPTSVAVDVSGALFIADTHNHRLRKVTAGVISTVAGNGVPAFIGDGAQAVAASFFNPEGIAVDASGNIFIADSLNYRIRKVSSGGVINTVAGDGTYAFAGDGGPAILALLNYPSGVALDSAGNLFIADSLNSRVRKVTPGGAISTFVEGLSSPGSVAVDSSGNVFISDCNNQIRIATPAGAIGTFASSNWSFCDYYYYYYFDAVTRGALALDAAGKLFVADTFNNRIRTVTPEETISVLAGTGSYGFNGDGGPAISALLRNPSGVAVDSAGNVYIVDTGSNRIRKVTPGGIISTVAGNGTAGFAGDGGPATLAQLSSPGGVAVAADGSLYIADTSNNRIRKVTAAGIISTIAGDGTEGFGGDGGAATSARLNRPNAVVVDPAGNLLIADTYNNRIRRVGFASTVPALTGLSPNIGGQGATVTVAFSGTSFASPLAIDAGSGVTVSNVTVVNEILATATLTIAPNVTPGVRNVNIATSLGTSGNIPFTVVPPFPDLSITSSHTGNLGVGFESTYVVGISNLGSATTTGAITMTDPLPVGLSYVSGVGDGWSCSSVEQIVTCGHSDPLPAGASTSINLTIAVGNAASRVIHAPKVTTDGDLFASNNVVSDATVVALPAASLRFTPEVLVAGDQATVELRLPAAFPNDVTGTLTLGFDSNAVHPIDDPAIQFAGGGRTVTFTIPANTLEARFAGNSEAGPIGFQAGTVAGTLSFGGTLQTGAVQTPFSSQATVPGRAPRIHGGQREPGSGGVFGLRMNLSSTAREVTQLHVQFETTPAVRLRCGDVAGCVASGNALTLDVKSMFDSWFAADRLFGSASNLHVPFYVDRAIRGSIVISLVNRFGTSNTMSFEMD